jgi:hypothetical protein
MFDPIEYKFWIIFNNNIENLNWKFYIKHKKDLEEVNLILIDLNSSQESLSLDIEWELFMLSGTINKTDNNINWKLKVDWLLNFEIDWVVERNNTDLSWKLEYWVFELTAFDFWITIDNTPNNFNSKLKINKEWNEFFNLILDVNKKANNIYELPINYESIDLSLSEILRLPSVRFYQNSFY